MRSLDAKLKAQLRGMKFVEGVRFQYPHGSLIIQGKKTLSLHKKRIERWLGRPLLLIENDHALGLVQFDDEKMVTPSVAKSLVDQHLMLESEFEAWFSDVEFLWAYRVTPLEVLDRPFPVKTPADAFLWIRPERIEFAHSAQVMWPLFRAGVLPSPFGMPPSYQEKFLEFAEWLQKQKLPKELEDDAREIEAEASLLAAGLLRLTDEELREMTDDQLAELYRLTLQLPNTEERDFLRHFIEEELHRRRIHFARKLLPCPSEKDETRIVSREDVLRILDGEAILYERAVCLVGSLVTSDKGGDVDILVRQEVPKAVFRRIAVRLGRPLSKLKAKVQIIRDDGPIASYIPLFDIVLVPSPYRDKVVEMARKASGVRIYRPTRTMKPIRIGGQPQTVENFMKLVEKHGPAGFIEGKLDGIHVELHFGDKGWKVWTEEGQEISEILKDRLEKYQPSKPCVLEGELELWRNGKHMPRELVSGDVHAHRFNSGFRITLFDCLYYGEDIHELGYRDRRKFLRAFGQDLGLKIDHPVDEFLSILPTHKVKSLKDVEKKMRELISHPYYEGVVWKKEDGKYYLDGVPRGTQVKWHRHVVVTGVVLDKKETKTEGIYTYTWGIEADDPRLKPQVTLSGKKYHVCGKTFGTNLTFQIGDPIRIELEGVTLARKGPSLQLTGYAPKVLKEVHGED